YKRIFYHRSIREYSYIYLYLYTYTDDYVTGIKNYENNVLEAQVEYGYNSGRMATAVTKEYSTTGALENTVTFTYTYTLILMIMLRELK
ncbi:hypothetical protein, partial [Chryseobacterium sp. CH1]|uniref:hypothetical protein n=1 Tax=Chryseobacterium sp. CH1 TaxID=713551 RepID=UPI001024CA24